MSEMLTVLSTILLLYSTQGQTINLIKENELVTSSLPFNITKQLTSRQFINPSTDFFIPQCHSKQHNFTLMEPSKWPARRAREADSSIGDIIFGGNQSSLTVLNTNNKSNFDIYCTYSRYLQSAPLPGGCNMEYNFENDPNIHVWYDGFQLWVQFQYSNVNDLKCGDSKNWSRLQYSIYVRHFEDGNDNSEKTFTDGLSSFISCSDIRKNGVKLMDYTRTESDKPAMVITSYPDQGVLVSIVVRDNVTGLEAAYVSQSSYGCDLYREATNHPCQVQWYFYLLASVLGILGLFLTFLGHKFFQTELFVNGYFTGTLCSFIILLVADVSLTALLLGSAAISVAIGALWWVVWFTAGIATLNVALVAANTGFLISSIVFYTPLANVSVFKNSWEMWIAYAAVMALMMPVTVLRAKKVNVLCCAFLGAYAATAALSVFIGASLHHIVLEPIRKATVEKYYDAIFNASFTARDGGLLALWILLAVAGSMIQFYTERRKPDFPVSPRKKRASRRIAAELDEQERLLNPPGGSSDSSDLRGSVVQSYGAM